MLSFVGYPVQQFPQHVAVLCLVVHQVAARRMRHAPVLASLLRHGGSKPRGSGERKRSPDLVAERHDSATRKILAETSSLCPSLDGSPQLRAKNVATLERAERDV